MIDFIIGFLGALGCIVGVTFMVWLIDYLINNHFNILMGIIVFGICFFVGYVRMREERDK